MKKKKKKKKEDFSLFNTSVWTAIVLPLPRKPKFAPST